MSQKRAYITIGTTDNYKAVLVKEGDVLQLVTGEKVTFTNMRRTKFEAILNGRSIIVPIWRNKHTSLPYVSAKLGRDESVVKKTTKVSAFNIGDLFSLEGSKETFMWKGITTSPRGKSTIQGLDIASGKTYRIASDMTMAKINLTKIKKEVKENA